MGFSAPHTNQVFHCYKESSVELCGFAQLCYYVSATALVMSLVPQMHKNSYLKSTAGLSSLWATSLFIATLVNCFFMFAIAKLIYFKIATVICCVTSFGLLCQFWMYSKQNVYFKVTLLGSCMVVSIALITVELAVPQPGAANKLEWLAVTLFSIDLLPQIILNIMEGSTLGQSNIAVVITTTAKSFKFAAMQILVTSVRFQCMAYIAAFIGHINCIQLIWYRLPQPRKKSVRRYGTEKPTVTSNEDSYAFEDSKTHEEDEDGLHDEVFSSQESITSLKPENYHPTYLGRLKRMAAWQILVGIFEITALIVLTAITSKYMNSRWILVAPCAIIIVLVFTTLYRDYREGTRHCWENAVDNMQYKMFGESTL